MRTRITIAAVTAALAVTLVGCSSGDDSSDASSDGSHSTPAPQYKITKQDTSGNSRNVEVTVEKTKDLKAVFNAVTKDLKEEAGYFVYINCSTGGTGTTDNRLANGKLARGNKGAAATGLKDGGTQFETVKGHTCP